MSRRAALALLGIVALAAILWMQRRPPADMAAVVAAVPTPATADTANGFSVAATATPTTRPAVAATPPTPDWPASLRDSTPDGAVTLDATGRVHTDLPLRRLFDYFLSAIGEMDIAGIRALLIAHVRALHGDAVAAQVAALFDRYVDYQRALSSVPAVPGEDLRARHERLRELRLRLLDPAMAEAFFGDEERYVDYTLDRRDLLADTRLAPADRDARLAELEERLTPGQRTQMREANAAVLVDEQNRQFDAMRMDHAQRQAEREALFGAEAAQRLAEVDVEIAAWDARVATYVRARDAIRADARLDATARERAVNDLRARSFDAAEQRRVGSLEAIGQL
jgi:lipase chaperone LimK